ncbi:alpha/beta fold hydrolase [Agitococcus lubricus]|uniref:Pimeloyl-ACP methyl ester carboxylesterase n=1 Tax=Agitococcus lubricus TaxID=1077255 RepID=A0A2T5IYW3_9GAMM|nr:alpha/beta hydrolase [Agitococcus lubricus]PTQ89146.1 pimeloyl-ACP methyl ester carboxylesterase [Agitococcus lubricus]
MPMLTLPQGKVHYRKMGVGTNYLVLLHANPGDSKDYNAIIDALTRNYCVITIDWPGYGTSDAPEPIDKASVNYFYDVLKGVIDEKALAEVTLMGNSIGGYAAARYAAEFPERVKSLVLISPAGFTNHNAMTRLFCRLQASSLAIPPIVLANFYLKGGSTWVKTMKSRALKEYGKTVPFAINRAIWRSMLLPDADLREKAKNIRCPTLLFFGQYDPLVSAKHDAKIAQAVIPHAELHISETGHAVFAESPEYFLGFVLKFLRKIYPNAA